MQIKNNAIIVIQEIYSSLNDKSSSLGLKVSMSKLSENLGMTQKFVNLCLGYLNSKGLIECDPSFTKDIDKSIVITAKGIDLIEGEV